MALCMRCNATIPADGYPVCGPCLTRLRSMQLPPDDDAAAVRASRRFLPIALTTAANYRAVAADRAWREARERGDADRAAVFEACHAAGRAADALEFVAASMSVEQVRARLAAEDGWSRSLAATQARFWRQ